MRAVLLVAILTSCTATQATVRYKTPKHVSDYVNKLEAELKYKDAKIAELESQKKNLIAKRERIEQSRVVYIEIPNPLDEEVISESEQRKSRTITVGKNENLGYIIKKYKVSFEDILKANPFLNRRRIDGKVDKRRWDNNWDPDYIKEGDILNLP